MNQMNTVKRQRRSTVLIVCALIGAAAVGTIIGGHINGQLREEAAPRGGIPASAGGVVYTGETY